VQWTPKIVSRGAFLVRIGPCTLCNSPPESLTPRSPTLESYLSGNDIILSWIAAALQASWTSDRWLYQNPGVGNHNECEILT
jgi:hypothetical protein